MACGMDSRAHPKRNMHATQPVRLRRLRKKVVTDTDPNGLKAYSLLSLPVPGRRAMPARLCRWASAHLPCAT